MKLFFRVFFDAKLMSGLILLFNPFIPVAAKITQQFRWYLSTISNIENIWRRNCSSELYLQLSFKYFANVWLISKLFSNFWQLQTSRTPGMNGLNHTRLVHKSPSRCPHCACNRQHFYLCLVSTTARRHYNHNQTPHQTYKSAPTIKQ